ncbi:hypothetical protein ACLB2K_014701 [Fragaria x ananassa]
MKPGKRSGGGGGGGRSSSFSDRRMNEFRNRLEASTELDHRSSVDEIVVTRTTSGSSVRSSEDSSRKP